MRVKGKIEQGFSKMTNYFNEAAYKRWLRQYEVNLDRYMDSLNVLRFRMDDVASLEEPNLSLKEIQALMDDIDLHLDRVLPRDFSEGREPLEGAERFFENLKILCDLIFSLFRRREPFVSVYQVEKERVLQEHREFKFKEKLLELKNKIDVAEAEETVETIETTG